MSKDRGSGITSIPGSQHRIIQESIITDTLLKRGVNPETITSEGMLQSILNGIKKEKDMIVKHYLDAVGLGDAFFKMPKELSQGMRQRVGIARAFALKPKMMLLDEPLGMLDALTKQELQDLIAKLHAEHKLTTLMVTHDVDEALYLSDRVVMMTNGPKATVGVNCCRTSRMTQGHC